MALDVSVQHQKTKEAARGTHCPRHGCRRLALARHAGDPFAQVGALEFFNLLVPCFRPGLQSAKIARVVLQRVNREAFLDLYVTKEFADEISLVDSFGHQKEVSTGGKDFSP